MLLMRPSSRGLKKFLRHATSASFGQDVQSFHISHAFSVKSWHVCSNGEFRKADNSCRRALGKQTALPLSEYWNYPMDQEG